MSSNKHKKIRIFHPPKLWVGLAILALTVGLSLGESHLTNTPAPEVFIGQKMALSMQAFSWGSQSGGKQGYSRQNYEVSTLGAFSPNPLKKRQAPTKAGMKSVCFIAEPVLENPEYKAELLEIKVSDSIQPGDDFRVEVYVKNTGNVNWYGADAGCNDKIVVNMGTEKAQDRASQFFHEGVETGWLGNNRVEMVEDIAKPDDVVTFAFTSVAPMATTIYREHFNLLAENTTWFNDFKIPVDIRVGDVTDEDDYKLKFLKDISVDTRSLEGDHRLLADLSEQKMTLVIGDTEVYHMTISSGARETPTPIGVFKILNKQELRVGGTAPHYRMPYWQGFTKMGHGIHALPYLGSPGGFFWEEALTHIGIPVSHGCIRMLPDDAALVYEFGAVGMEIEIQR